MQTEATKQIAKLDQQIDAIRDELITLVGEEPKGAAGWQQAWNRHPELQARERDLFRKRGELQVIRDQQAYEAARRAARNARGKPLKKCPACGARTLSGNGPVTVSARGQRKQLGHSPAVGPRRDKSPERAGSEAA